MRTYFYPLGFAEPCGVAGPGFSYAPAMPRGPAPPVLSPSPSVPIAPAPPTLTPGVGHLVPYAVVYTNGAKSFSIDPHSGGFRVSRFFENANVDHLIVVVSDHHLGTDPQVMFGPTYTLSAAALQIAERGFAGRFPRKSPRETRFYFIRVGKSILWTQDLKSFWHLAGALDFHVCAVGSTYNELQDTCVGEGVMVQNAFLLATR